MILLAVLLIVSSLMHIQKLVVDRDVYLLYYNYLPPWLSVTRYGFSWLQRLAGVLIAAGLLGRKEIARKLAILLGCFTIVTVPWKHPYSAFKIHAQYLNEHLGYLLRALGAPVGSFDRVIWPSIVIHSLGDILFWGAAIYFLTRPAVKKQFGRL